MAKKHKLTPRRLPAYARFKPGEVAVFNVYVNDATGRQRAGYMMLENTFSTMASLSNAKRRLGGFSWERLGYRIRVIVKPKGGTNAR